MKVKRFSYISSAVFLMLLFLCDACIASNMHGQYSDEEIEYFCEIALGNEYGDDAQVIKKWGNSPKIKVFGQPRGKDLIALNAVIDKLKSITGLDIQQVDRHHSIALYFLPEAQFESVLPQYEPVNYGYFWTWWNSDYELYKAVILISTSDIDQEEREHLIREELTQALGLMNDSERFQESIFQVEWTYTAAYAPIDVTIIEMLYRPEIQAGMSKEEVLEILEK